jgi:transcriptional regulator with XRE-family HTH domain
MKDYSSNITRALRKHYSITQKDFCELINASQGTLSKIESGHLSLSATQWVYLCDYFKIPPTALLTGKIEVLKEDKKIELITERRIGTFKIPTKYYKNMGSTVRTLYPILNYITSIKGENSTKELVESLQMDPDYFIIQSHPISIRLINDIVELAAQQGILSSRNIKEILTSKSTSEAHSYFMDQIGTLKKQESLFKNILSFIPKYYEINSKYEYIGDKNCLVKVTNNQHMQEIEINDNFNAFRQEFNELHFQELSKNFSFEKEITSIKTDTGWNIAYCG